MARCARCAMRIFEHKLHLQVIQCWEEGTGRLPPPVINHLHLVLDLLVEDLDHHLHEFPQVSNFRAISWTEGLLGAASKGGEVKVFPSSNYLSTCPRAGKSSQVAPSILI